jgi:hypothetical protein
MNRPKAASAKKPYEAPKLLIYGNLLEMTQATNMMGMMDGGPIGGPRKTA